MTASLRNRLLVGTIGAMVLLLICFSLLVYAVIRRALISEFDASLASVADILAASVEVDANEIDVDFEVQQMPEFNDPDKPLYYQIWQRSGDVVARSPLLGTRDLAPFHGAGERRTRAIRPPWNRRAHRAISMDFVPRVDPENAEWSQVQVLALVVARDTGTLHGRLALLQWLLLGSAAATSGLAFLVAFVVVGRGLSPLQAIAGEIAAIDEEDLAARVGRASLPSELTPIRDRLNGLLSRLEKAFERERRFSADVAHELRTPLAGIRTTVEVALTAERDAAEYRAVLSECLEIATGMQSMVDTLLMLARLDVQQVRFKTQPIQLAELIESSWLGMAERAGQRDIRFENRVGAETTCPSDPEHLSRVFTNLLDNAVAYADHGGRIWTTAQRTDGAMEIAVSNTGCSLTAEQVAHVFDSFWRGDASRSATGTHCGLGLALVQRLMTALGGSAAAHLEPGGIFTLRLTLPASQTHR